MSGDRSSSKDAFIEDRGVRCFLQDRVFFFLQRCCIYPDQFDDLIYENTCKVFNKKLRREFSEGWGGMKNEIYFFE